jgi:catechol 2,3-dioxygenase-like lactoylglutathione lyase family enzyme
MARILGPDFVALQVRDLEVSARFYEQRLGLERAPQRPADAVVFATEPIAFALRQPLVDLDAVDRLGWGVALWLRCDDDQALCDSLVEADMPIAQEPFDGPFGRTFVLVDADGYRVTVLDGG